MALKLTYFDARGRAEISRLVLHAANKKFEDKRIEFADWPALKAKTPYGGLPILECDGEVHGQGLAIATFLARENGLYGKTNKDGLMIDQIMQCREDLLIAESKAGFEKDEAIKVELNKNLAEETYPKYLKIYSDIIEKNQKKCKSSFAVGSQMSLGDIAIFEAFESLAEHAPDALAKFPLIKELRGKVAACPGISKYLAARKPTQF